MIEDLEEMREELDRTTDFVRAGYLSAALADLEVKLRVIAIAGMDSAGVA
jgi:hypothetical protein